MEREVDFDAVEEGHSEQRPEKRQRRSEQPVQEQIVKPIGTGTSARALRSVLRVYVTSATPNYAQPWQMRPQRSSSGSAFIIDVEERHMLTNAHVVSSSTSLHVRKPGCPKKWQARVLCMGHVCDLALLTVEEDAFWDNDNLMGLKFSSVPELQDSILVAGYPAGGDSLSITQGVVSRCTMARYAHSSKLLGIQIDAAINPGNSGGPAFSNLEKGIVGGIAFSKLQSADNIGYLIPTTIAEHFLAEYREHGVFRGICSIGFRFQEMENEHLRKHYQVPEGRSGSLVYQIDPLSDAAKHLQQEDVILEVDGIPIADDGTIEFRKEERVDFAHIIRSKHIDEILKILLLRDGKELEVGILLQARKPLVPILHGFDCLPSFFIVGGLVFLPLSMPFLAHAYGDHGWRKSAPPQVVALISDYAQQPDEQVVILFQVLASELNFGYKLQTIRCEAVNNTKIKNLKHLATTVDNCRDKYLKFKMGNQDCSRIVILDREQAERESPHILEQHAIAFDRSPELRNLRSSKQ